MIPQLLQIWIVLTGALSIWILTGRKYHRLGCWIGLAGQPAWFLTTYENFQWGIFMLALIYTASYLRGIVNLSTKEQSQ